jgi:hypothetical protein
LLNPPLVFEPVFYLAFGFGSDIRSRDDDMRLDGTGLNGTVADLIASITHQFYFLAKVGQGVTLRRSLFFHVQSRLRVPTARRTPLDPPRHASQHRAPVLHAALANSTC